ncbi:MAG: metallophosphoesterase family protein [Jatrophihabitans sp.]|uniref:metallophosphoesterase family protein n=1 Tax=Jatrophihabitans sp. TaxID=1932789 RepID=UPI003F7E4477
MRLRTVSAIAIGTAVVALAGTAVAGSASDNGNDWPYAAQSGHTYTLAAVGDIACEPADAENAATPSTLKCGSASLGGYAAEYATAGQADAMHPDAVALLGDEQYEVGKLSDFEQSFEQAWGGLKFLEHPAPGNHEYYAYKKKGDNEAAQNGTGYFGYFNGHDQSGTPNTQGQAGDDTDARQGWYSYDLGKWHIVSLNIECNSAAFGNDCSTTDQGLLAQETQWLAADLRANHSQCTLAYWHQPTFTAADSSADVADPSAPGADTAEGGAADAWWKLLYQHPATLVLNGHEHYYARLRPMDPAGHADPRNGIPEFIVGSGGEALDTIAREHGGYSNPNVVTGQDSAYGVLKLTLGSNGYSWDYRPALAGAGFGSSALNYHDSGSASCRGGDDD